MRSSVLATLVAAALTAAAPNAAGAQAGPPPRDPATCPPGGWIRSATAAWVWRVVAAAGYRAEACTGSAWIATARTAFYIWAAPVGESVPGLKAYTAVRLPLPTLTDGTRLSWRVQGLRIWVEAGPSPADSLPGRTALGWLQIASKNLPRRYGTIPLMQTPPAALARCRSDERLRPACPTRLPRVPGWETYPRVVDGVFGLQLGGEIPGRPELMRPPHVLHVEVAVDPDRWVPFAWPVSGAVAPRDGLMRQERRKPILLGRVRWAGRSGSVALAPGFPTGGSQGNHVVFRWREDGETYAVGLHAWEPFSEAYAALRRVVASLPRG